MIDPLGVFRERNQQPELMDQAGVAVDAHHAALAGLRRLNSASNASGALWRAIRATCSSRVDRSLRVLDIACGGGDLARGVWHRAKRDGFEIELHGVDRSETAIQHARKQSHSSCAVSFSCSDALLEPLPEGYDVVTCSLFLHHLAEAQAVELLRRMAAAAKHAVVFSDLRRSAVGYALAVGACRLLSRSRIVWTDGPRSVRGAFTLSEIHLLAEAAGLHGVQIRRQWPQRMMGLWWKGAVG